MPDSVSYRRTRQTPCLRCRGLVLTGLTAGTRARRPAGILTGWTRRVGGGTGRAVVALISQKARACEHTSRAHAKRIDSLQPDTPPNIRSALPKAGIARLGSYCSHPRIHRNMFPPDTSSRLKLRLGSSSPEMVVVKRPTGGGQRAEETFQAQQTFTRKT